MAHLYGLRRFVASICMFIALSIGGLAAAVFMPTAAFAAPCPEASLALDRIGHAVQINGEAVDPNTAFVAFGTRALIHDRYSAGGFALDRVDAQS